VVPAQAGTHTPQQFGFITEASFFYNHQRQGFWVPACAGTTLSLLVFRTTFRIGFQKGDALASPSRV
ncbi:MAG: hypothetical protein WBH00_16545, partial [Xanthobacteraceae bacterium]